VNPNFQKMNNATTMELSASIEALKSGKTILYPTDTIWGIGCDATDDSACQKILTIKNRPTSKSFILLVDSIAMLEKYAPDFHPVCYDLIDYSDKPLTIIYPIAKNLAPTVTSEDGSVAIRVTKDPICLQLIRSIRKPIVSTSANISGEKSPASFSEIAEQIKNNVDAIVPLRQTEKGGSPSQIIKIDLDGTVKILRN
jgi:L-threonylcarbamoyladenylate synthase